MEDKGYKYTLTKMFIVLAGLGGVVGQVLPDKYYCSLSSDHTMCAYTTFDSMQLQCHSYNQTLPTILERIMLEKHNSLRNNYADYGGGNFTVPNMLALTWDLELAAIAARWAWQCPHYEDDYRDVYRFRVANLVGVIGEDDHFPKLDDIWDELTEGRHFFHRLRHRKDGRTRLRSMFRLDESLSLLTNPYFKHVGCSSAKYRQIVNGVDEYRRILVCNYGPLDMPYNPVQPRGPTCSLCPSATSCIINSTYENLCFDNLVIHDHRKDRKARIKSDVDQGNSTDKGKDEGKYNDGPGDTEGTENRLEVNLTEFYCNITCGNGEPHTLCLYQGPTDEYEEVIPLMKGEDRVTILNVHNIIRDAFASGKKDGLIGQKSTGLPLASNMRELWSDELAGIAWMWASQCKRTKDGCRDAFLTHDIDIPSYVSQLIDYTIWTGKEGEFPSPESSFVKWQSSGQYFKAENIDLFKAKDYSNFAQIIWANTYQLGCGMSMCRNKSSPEALIVTVCNYGPGGNIEGHAVYTKGGPCTRCRRLNRTSLGGMYCSMEYPHLCSGAAFVLTQFVFLSIPATLAMMVPQ